MDVNRLFSMIVRMVVARLVRIGVNKGIDLATRSTPQTPENAAQTAEAAALARRARRTARLTRRMGP